MCLRTNIRGGRQLSMFMSENICTMVDLSHEAVAGGGGGGGQDNHCGKEVRR